MHVAPHYNTKKKNQRKCVKIMYWSITSSWSLTFEVSFFSFFFLVTLSQTSLLPRRVSEWVSPHFMFSIYSLSKICVALASFEDCTSPSQGFHSFTQLSSQGGRLGCRPSRPSFKHHLSRDLCWFLMTTRKQNILMIL